VGYQNLEIETARGVATVWMNRPERHNAFDDTMIGEVTAAFTALEADAMVRLVVLAGRGKSFSAGADLNWMRKAASYTAEENLRDARALATMLKTIDRLTKPTVARVHGAALGGGAGLAAACDIAIASTQASFATTEVKFGIVPAAISPYVIRAVGERMAGRYFLTAERFDAREAQRIGMVHEVVEPDSLDARIRTIVDSLLMGGPKAQAAAKALIRGVAKRPLDDAVIDYTAQCIGSLRTTPEAREGIAAFLDKRAPGWLGG
jgi:methylglutaconyl-CoA hydratase